MHEFVTRLLKQKLSTQLPGLHALAWESLSTVLANACSSCIYTPPSKWLSLSKLGLFFLATVTIDSKVEFAFQSISIVHVQANFLANLT